jgi:hypothetical protein
MKCRGVRESFRGPYAQHEDPIPIGFPSQFSHRTRMKCRGVRESFRGPYARTRGPDPIAIGSYRVSTPILQRGFFTPIFPPRGFSTARSQFQCFFNLQDTMYDVPTIEKTSKFLQNNPSPSHINKKNPHGLHDSNREASPCPSPRTRSYRVSTPKDSPIASAVN